MHPSGSGMMEAQWERAQFPSILDHSHKARWLRDLDRKEAASKSSQGYLKSKDKHEAQGVI